MKKLGLIGLLIFSTVVAAVGSAVFLLLS